jgi:phosphoglycolate phosphatase
MTNRDKAVIFDWNGTLLDDVTHTIHATNAVLEHLGHAPVTLDRYRKHCRVPIAHMYQDFGVDMDELTRHKTVIHDMWNGIYNTRTQMAGLRQGAQEALDSLKRQEQRVIILSNHTVENIAGHAQRFGIHEHFEAILAYESYGAAFLKQVKGERLKSYIEQHKINEGIVVGDTEEEVDIARAHGFTAVAIMDGVCSTERLKAAKPDFLIDDLRKIPAIADQVFGHKRRRA